MTVVTMGAALAVTLVSLAVVVIKRYRAFTQTRKRRLTIDILASTPVSVEGWEIVDDSRGELKTGLAPILRQLTQEGLVACESDDSRAKLPGVEPRRLYRLTRKGRDSAARSTAQL